MTVAVTGAPGWLGTEIVKSITMGVNFNGIDFPSRNVRCLVLKDSNYSVLKKLDVDIRFGDVTRPDTLNGLFDGVETVIHLCGVIHPSRGTREFYEVNTKGTENVLKASIDSGVRTFIYMSSNSAAGIRRSREIINECDSPKPYMGYGKSKILAENLALKAAKENLIKATVLRTCWFYGPNQPERQTRFFKMIKSGNPIIFGSGENLRSLSYIDNSIQGILLAEKSEVSNGRIYWIADKRPYRTIEIYQTIAEILGVKDFRPFHVPGILSEICMFLDHVVQKMGFYIPEIHVAGEMNKDIACSIEKAQKELGYYPEVELKEGMKRSIEWCRNNGVEL